MNEITLSIDGQEVKTKASTTVLRAAQEAGIYIPALCDHPDLKPTGACRLCIVEIEGQRRLLPSCTTPAAEGMVVQTNSPRVTALRRKFLELLLTEHPSACITCERTRYCRPFDVCLRRVTVTDGCIVCPKNERCELQTVARYIGIEEVTFPYTTRALPIERDNPFFDRDYNLCILCGRCVRICQEVRGVGAIAFVYRGNQALVGTAFGDSLKEADCRFCGACVEVCPTGALIDLDGKWGAWPDREAALVPCKHACPANVDVPRYVHLITQGKFAEALAVVREKVPFPAVLGHVCSHPCETECRRGWLNEPIAIRALKRFAAEQDTGIWKEKLTAAKPTGKRVAVAGSGPAGLTVAYYLARLGHSVTVFEALPEPGGMMRVGVAEFRLPRKVVDAEIEVIKSLGVDIRTNTTVESPDELFKQGYDAVFLAIGAHRGTKIGVEGEDSPKVIECLSFLRDVNLGKEVTSGDRVAVVGEGHAAIEASRVARRLGAKKVTVVCQDAPLEKPNEEMEDALKEGVEILFLSAPKKIIRNDGRLRLDCLQLKLTEPDTSGKCSAEPIPGSDFKLDVDMVISAVGQVPEIPAGFGLAVTERNTLQADPETLATSRDGVFAGGDAVTGPASIIKAIAAGRKAAIAIDRYLGGDGVIDETLAPAQEIEPCLGRDGSFAESQRRQMPCLPVEQRLNSFAEVEAGFTKKKAVEEAGRCLRCDIRLQITPVTPPPSLARHE